MKLVWLPDAQQNRRDAIEYIAFNERYGNINAAMAQLDAIERQTSRLIDQPRLGRPGRITDTRELVITGTPLIVVYRLTPERIEIVAFLHGRQQRP